MIFELVEEQKSKIKNYKYTSVGISYFNDFYSNICNKIIKYIPTSISPNLISLTGLLVIMLNTFIVNYLEFPLSLNCLITATSLFIYQLCDRLDGMQCKRIPLYYHNGTGNYYNATTELFDHGCDSIVLSLSFLNSIKLFEVTDQNVYMLMYLCIATMFYLPTWQHSCINIMDYQSGMKNPDMALLIMQIFTLLLIIIPLQNNIYLQYIYLIILIYNTILSLINSINCVLNNKENENIVVITTRIANPSDENDDVSTTMTSEFFNHNDIIKYITFLPLIVVWLHGFSNDLMFVMLTWNLSILYLIWYEITKIEEDFVIVLILIGFIRYNPILLMGYICSLCYQTSILCKVLSMKHFFSTTSSATKAIN